MRHHRIPTRREALRHVRHDPALRERALASARSVWAERAERLAGLMTLAEVEAKALFIFGSLGLVLARRGT